MAVTVGDLLRRLIESAVVRGVEKICIAGHILPSYTVTGEIFTAAITCVDVVEKNGVKDIAYEEYVVRSNVMGFEHIEKALSIGSVPKFRLMLNQYGLVTGVELIEEDVTDEIAKRLEGSPLLMRGTIIGGREVVVDLGGVRVRYSPLVPTNMSTRIRQLYHQGVNEVDIVMIPDPTIKPTGRTIRVTRAIVLNKPVETAVASRVEGAAELIARAIEEARRQQPQPAEEARAAGGAVDEERSSEELTGVEEEEGVSEEELAEIERELSELG